MKYVKLLGLLAMVATALIGLVGTASATTVTSTTEGLTPTIHASTLVGAKWTLHNNVGTLACDSTIISKVEKHGEKDSSGRTLPATGLISTLSFTNCSGGVAHTVGGHVSIPGSLAIHPIPGKTGNGTLTWSDARFTVTMFGIECGYETNNTHLGEVIGGEHAVFKISGSITRSHGSFFCGDAKLTGEYKVNHPTDLTIH